jgi:sulfite reductase (ferredoxin)
VVANYLADREVGETFAAWTIRADEILLRGEKALG